MTASTTVTTGDPTGNAAAQPSLPPEAEQYRRELLAHCYRMMGSVQDAEDMVQETYLRAWRAFNRFEQRASVRTWLYKIATNTCLNALGAAGRRMLPSGLGQEGVDADAPRGTSLEIDWLEPFPDSLMHREDPDPAVAADTKEDIRLAMVAALQVLPPRQRAVLILREVLQWSAAEVATALESTPAAVNSLLQRARARLDELDPAESDARVPRSGPERALLEQWVDAFWEKDITRIVSLLDTEAVWEMPPYVQWYPGAENIGRLIESACPGGRHDMRLLRTTANGQPAFGLYLRSDSGFLPFHLQVLTVGENGVRHVAAFFDTSLFATFGLPARLPVDWQPEDPAVIADPAP